jgi:hypothetical protein
MVPQGMPNQIMAPQMMQAAPSLSVNVGRSSPTIDMLKNACMSFLRETSPQGGLSVAGPNMVTGVTSQAMPQQIFTTAAGPQEAGLPMGNTFRSVPQGDGIGRAVM